MNNNIKIYKFENKQEASKFAAKLIYDEIDRKKDINKNIVFGTATGQTPVLTYVEFMKLVENSSWWNEYSKNIILRQLDNYISPNSSKDNLPEYSYELELSNSIWKIPNGGTYIPKEWAEDPEQEAKRYEEIIEETNSNSNLKIQMLGIGDEDGHLAFNMPGDSFDSKVHVVNLNQETITANANKFFGGDENKVPRRAVTTGLGNILDCDFIILEAFGSKKSDIIWKTFFTEATTNIPSTCLQTIEEDKKVFVILDEESAKTIEEKEGNQIFEKI